MPKDRIEVLVNGRIKGIWDGKTADCGKPGKPGCGAEIGFAKTEAGKFVPFNVEDYTSHFATCPVRNNFKTENDAV